ncbi:hypothetical protein AM500_10825 [Bacillus sp. FJAT-18017]|jgi:hypothetical protein|uniref:hypothetical protein n=1 Tax=Bacillus sp. FJAT-18017 TaxID=1705566 RepID=UPI0006AFA4BA|nr:hypothetical protein [Bacillus sp. FJAT-18017]ALC90220.1 hypothetical protein AM500_10825 [Bacillus sp. FJAT-18017]
MDYQHLLTEYRKLWNNRQLEESNLLNSEETLKEAIRRELLDENSHPRVRKGKYEKFYTASKRLLASSLKDSDKTSLLEIYVEIMENL